MIATLAILAWFPITLALFACLRPRHAVLVAYLGAWLFLPMGRKASLALPMLPDLDKITASSFAVVLGIMLFDSARVFSFRFRWFDVPMLAWCVTPFMSAITNGLGPWEGMSAILEHLVWFGIPYYIGRIYFNDWDSFRELAIAIFVGGVVYIPLCLFEIRMSPQLHQLVYGYHQHSFEQTKRLGGFRPMVFMQHGLAVGFWMTAASLIGLWLMVSGAMRQLLGIPMIVLVPILLVTTILCKSTAGVGFLFVGIAALLFIKYTKTALPIYMLVALAPVYMVLRTTGVVDGTKLVEMATQAFGEERAESLGVRMHAENVLSAHAMKKALFGYGRFAKGKSSTPAWMPRNDDTGKKAAIPDGMWIITMGKNGLSGVFWLTTAILLPPLLLRKRVPPQWWDHPMAAPAAACAVLLTLHMADNLLNAMINPIFICTIGGLCALGVRNAVQQTAAPQQMPRNAAAMQQQMRLQQQWAALNNGGGMRRPGMPVMPQQPMSPAQLRR